MNLLVFLIIERLQTNEVKHKTLNSVKCNDLKSSHKLPNHGIFCYLN